MNKKVISFCVYGNKPMYTKGMVENLKLSKEFYPDWEVYIYVSKTVPKDVLLEYKKYTKNIFLVNDSDRGFFMSYRYLAASDVNVEYAIFRDADSRLTEREAAAVEEWLEAGTDLHIMIDHPWHSGVPILGGMFGLKCSKVRDMKNIIYKYFSYQQEREIDQYILKMEIYPRLKNSVTKHDEFYDNLPYPKPCLNGEFVGCQFDENNNVMYPEHIIIRDEHINNSRV